MNKNRGEKKANDWLAANGITLSQFNQAEIWQLQAQKIAKHLLKHHIDQLNDKEQSLLMDFCGMMLCSKQRDGITKRMTYEVMNMGKKFKRKEFKANKRR